VKIYRQRFHSEGPFAGQTEIYRPVRNRDGKYVLGDPMAGETKHHKDEQIYEANESKALSLIKNGGCSIRMKGELTGQRNMITPDKIVGL
jgi:hypothetical protein